MVMDRKPFEIVAECQMAGFPTGADIGRIREQIETARRSRPEVVRAAVNPPAIYRDKWYVLPARFVVWAEDGTQAIQTVAGLLQDAGVPCRTVLPSGRGLTEAEVPPPPEPKKGRQAVPGSRKPAASRRPRKAGRKPHRSPTRSRGTSG